MQEGRVAAAKKLGASIARCPACGNVFRIKAPYYVPCPAFDPDDELTAAMNKRENFSCGMRCALTKMLSDEKLTRVLLIGRWNNYHVARKDTDSPRGYMFDNDGETLWNADVKAGENHP